MTDARSIARALQARPELQKARVWCAVDRGLLHVPRRYRRKARAVGDWDGLGEGDSKRGRARAEKLGSALRTFPQGKAFSDWSGALDWATEEGVTHVFALGFLGGRGDHEWAVIQESVNRLQAGTLKRVELLGEERRLVLFRGEAREGPAHKAECRAGRTISVFSVGQVARGIRIRGLKYEWEGKPLRPSSQGLSNETTGKRWSVSVRSGVVALFVEGARDE
jgi:thiamine pyrophosphokinase